MSDNGKSTQLLVIGAGPAGYTAAFRAADLGLKVVLVDPEKNPGGVCLYRGCIPSKALLHVAGVINEAKRAADIGVKFGKPEIDIDAVRSFKDGVVSKLTKGLGGLCKQREVEYIRGKARLTGENSARVEPANGDAFDLSFENATVATGSQSASIPSAIESKRVIRSREALDLSDIPSSLLVVGAGYIGLEIGQVYSTLGSKVTVVEMMPQILPGADKDLVKILEKRLREQFEDIMLGAKVVEMKEQKNGIRVRFEGENIEKESRIFDRVLLAVGRKPRTDGVGLEDVGVELTDGGFIKVDAQRRTNISSIFAIGDAAGQPMLAHKGAHEGMVAAEVVDEKLSAYDVTAVPAVIFTDPEVAWVGLTENEAKESGVEYEVLKFPWAASGRASTLGENEGLTKLLVEPKSGRLLGAAFAGKGAGELVAEVTLAIEMGAVAEDLALTVHTHPTLSETIMEAAEMFGGAATHFYSKRRPKS